MNATEVTEVEDRGPAAYIAEFVGTLLLVFFITAVVSLFVSPDPTRFTDFSVVGLVHAFLLFALVQTLAIISGAHFNPAVTVVMTALRQIKPPDAAVYIVAQLAGAVAGALITKLLLENEGEAVNYGAPAVSERILDGSILPGMVAEALGTFFLVWVIVGVAVNPRATKEWAALAIGTALGMGVMVFAPLTGAGFNPARAFGPAIVSGEFGGADTFLLVYVLAPIIGALVAGFLYFNLVLAPGKRGPGAMEPVG
jgi:glycerol uptake facilitator protein